jgi:flagellin-like protein
LRRLLKDKRGISPVITTVILVAVGIALAVAIGLWMSGLVATFTRFEKLEVTSAYATATTSTTGSGTSGWTVTITVKNTGSADATITMVMINGVPTKSVTGITWDQPTKDPSDTNVPISVGSSATFQFTLNNGATIGSGTASSGITLNIVLHSAAGKDYPASVTLP